MTASDGEGVWTDYVRLDQIRPAELNPQRHDIERLMVLFEEHGCGTVGKVDERTGRLVGGHGRTEALVEMLATGRPRPWGIGVDDDGMWLAPIERGWASRDDAQAKEMLLALNWSQDWGGPPDPVITYRMLEDVALVDPDALDRLNKTDEDLEALFAQVNPDLPDVTGAEDDRGDSLGPDTDPLPREEDTGHDVQCPSCGHRFGTKV